MARSTSTRAVLMGLAASWQMVRANSSRRFVRACAISRRMLARCCDDILRVAANACTADSTATSASERSASLNTARTLWSYGAVTTDSRPCVLQPPFRKYPMLRMLEELWLIWTLVYTRLDAANLAANEYRIIGRPAEFANHHGKNRNLSLWRTNGR